MTIIEFDVVLTGSSAKYGQGKIGVCMAVLEGDTGKKERCVEIRTDSHQIQHSLDAARFRVDSGGAILVCALNTTGCINDDQILK